MVGETCRLDMVSGSGALVIRGTDGLTGSGQENHMMREKLGLSEEQVRDILDTDLFFREKQSALRAELKYLQKKMKQVCLASSFDRTALLLVAGKIAELKKTLYLEKTEARLAIRYLLTSEQVEKLRLHRIERKKEDGNDLSDIVPVQHSSRTIKLSRYQQRSCQ